MDIITKLKDLLAEVGKHTETQLNQFASKTVTKTEKDTLISMANKIKNLKSTAESLVDGLKIVLENKNTDIEKIDRIYLLCSGYWTDVLIYYIAKCHLIYA